MIMARDHIHIHDLRVDCIVGIHPHERHHPQPLILELELGLDASLAGYSGRISATVDYVQIADEVEHLLVFRSYRLLETAGEELCAMLLGVHPQLLDIRLRMNKPRALEGRAHAVGVEVERSRAELGSARERSDWGEVEVLYRGPEARLQLFHIEPGCTLPTLEQRSASTLEWLVEGELERDGQRVGGFAPRVWPQGAMPVHVNVGSARASLFCCDVSSPA
jgi:dihydroneopterin aldolase